MSPGLIIFCIVFGIAVILIGVLGLRKKPDIIENEDYTLNNIKEIRDITKIEQGRSKK
jgi:hypothetical protein